MRRQDFSHLERKQKSVFYYSDLAAASDPLIQDRPQYRQYLYPSMLGEDIADALLPLQKEKYSFRIDPQNQKLEEMLTFALNKHQYRANNLMDAAYSFFNEVGHCLVYYSECAYEIVELLNPATETLEAFDLTYIQPMTMVQQSGKWIQQVPKLIANERSREQYIPIAPEKLLIFQLPDYIRQEWLPMMDSLAAMNEITPGFGIPKPTVNENKVPFDFSVHNQVREQAIAKVTSKIGWNMRKYPHEGMLEYYWFHRFLLFEKLKIELRESILKTLNDGLNHVLDQLGMTGTIVIEGLPTLKDIIEAKHDLRTGKKPAKEILEHFRIL
jgi:hypothetical protein